MKRESAPTAQKPRKERIERIDGLPYHSEIVEMGKKYKLTSHSRHLLHILRAAMNPANKVCWKGEETLAEEMGCSRSTVAKAIKGLKKKNIITIRKQKKKMGFRNNVYAINYPWESCITKEQTRVHYEDIHTSPKNTSIYIPERHACVREVHTNKSKKNLLRGIGHPQQVKAEEDDSLTSLPEKKQTADIISREAKYSPAHREDIIGEGFVPPAGAPPAATQEVLERFYGSNIPDALDLTASDQRVDLQKYIYPFREKGEELLETCGRDLDRPLDKWFESQCEEFYERAISRNWNQSARKRPQDGFKKIFLRGCRAGVMYRAGFRPKTLEQIEADKQEKERMEMEQLERNRKEAEEQEKREGKKRRLMAFVSRKEVYEYLYLKGFTDPKSGIVELDQAREWLRGLKENQKIDKTSDVINYCVEETRQIQYERKRKEERSKLDKRLIADKKMLRFFRGKGWIPPDPYPSLGIPLLQRLDLDKCLDHLDVIRKDNEVDTLEELFTFLENHELS